MFKRSLWTAAGLLTVAATVFLAQTSAPPAPPDLPPGNMQAKARTACMECHDAGIMLQQRLDKATWTKEMDKMIRWGAVVDPKDRDAMIDYFSTNFPVDKPLEPAARVTKERSQKKQPKK